MNYSEFSAKLDEMGLSKKDFAAMVGRSHNSVINWSQAGDLPAWVDSWIENYRKARLLDEIALKFNEIYGSNLANLS